MTKEPFPWTILLDILINLLIGEFVPLLIFTVIRLVFLNRIICQMNSLKIRIYLVLWWRCSDATVSVPISFSVPIYASYQEIVSDIYFPSFVKKWFLYVFLDDVGLEGSISPFLSFLQYPFYFLQIMTYLDSITSVCILTWF